MQKCWQIAIVYYMISKEIIEIERFYKAINRDAEQQKLSLFMWLYFS